MTVANINTSDPRVKRTRRLLQDAFMSLVREKGFEALTAQDISERSTVNRATFYAHYENKFALAEDLVLRQFKARLAESVPIDSPVTEPTLEALFLSVLGFIADVYGPCRLDRQFLALLEGAMYRAMHEFTFEWLSKNQGNGLKADPGITACVLSAAVIGVGVKSGQGERSLPESEFVREVVSVLGRGITGNGNGLAHRNGR